MIVVELLLVLSGLLTAVAVVWVLWRAWPSPRPSGRPRTPVARPRSKSKGKVLPLRRKTDLGRSTEPGS